VAARRAARTASASSGSEFRDSWGGPDNFDGVPRAGQPCNIDIDYDALLESKVPPG
jgi:hypothetical protein